MFVSAVLLASPTARAQDDTSSSLQTQADDSCHAQTEFFPLKKKTLTVVRADGGVLFTAGMTIDADGAPNAYGPHNRGLDFTANAHGRHGWSSVVTNRKGRPMLQKSGPYRGYYISTTSLQYGNVADRRNPKRYIDAATIPYIALPPDFARKYDIHLGDLAVVANPDTGLTAYAIFADVGPSGKIGEGSIALAKQLGLRSNPRRDSVADGLIYLIFPGSGEAARSHSNLYTLNTAADPLYERWGGTERLQTIEFAALDTFAPPPTGCTLEP